MKYVFMLVAAGILSSCSACSSDTGEIPSRRQSQPESTLGTKIVHKLGVHDLYRLEDPEKDVICYVPQYGHGIFCFTKKELSL